MTTIPYSPGYWVRKFCFLLPSSSMKKLCENLDRLLKFLWLTLWRRENGEMATSYHFKYFGMKFMSSSLTKNKNLASSLTRMYLSLFEVNTSLLIRFQF